MGEFRGVGETGGEGMGESQGVGETGGEGMGEFRGVGETGGEGLGEYSSSLSHPHCLFPPTVCPPARHHCPLS